MAISGIMASALGASDVYEDDMLFEDNELDLDNMPAHTNIHINVLNIDDVEDLDMSTFDIGGIKATLP